MEHRRLREVVFLKNLFANYRQQSRIDLRTKTGRGWQLQGHYHLIGTRCSNVKFSDLAPLSCKITFIYRSVGKSGWGRIAASWPFNYRCGPLKTDVGLIARLAIVAHNMSQCYKRR